MKHLLWFTMVLLFVGCKSVKYVEVPMETVKTEYVYGSITDSVLIKDSVDRFIYRDTVYIIKTHVERQRTNKIDTITRIDSIPQIVTVEKIVEVNKQSWWQKALTWIGGIILAILIIILIYRIVKMIK